MWLFVFVYSSVEAGASYSVTHIHNSTNTHIHTRARAHLYCLWSTSDDGRNFARNLAQFQCDQIVGRSRMTKFIGFYISFNINMQMHQFRTQCFKFWWNVQFFIALQANKIQFNSIQSLHNHTRTSMWTQICRHTKVNFKMPFQQYVEYSVEVNEHRGIMNQQSQIWAYKATTSAICCKPIRLCEQFQLCINSGLKTVEAFLFFVNLVFCLCLCVSA